MISPSRKNRSAIGGSKPDIVSSYEFIKAYQLVGLSASNVVSLGSNIDEGLPITPSVTIEAGDLLTYFDFTAPSIVPSITTPQSAIQRQITAKRSISYSFFTNFENGDQFTLSDANYDFGKYNLGGTYTFLQYINNVVVATGVTIDNYIVGKYKRESFDSTPVFRTSVTKTTVLPKNTFRITNTLGGKSKNSFEGIKQGDILEIFDIKYKVILRSLDIYDVEYVTIEALQIDEVLGVPELTLDTKNIINLYRVQK